MVRASSRLQNKATSPPIKDEPQEQVPSKIKKGTRKLKKKTQDKIDLIDEEDINLTPKKEVDLDCDQLDIPTADNIIVKQEPVDPSDYIQTETEMVQAVKQEFYVKAEIEDPEEAEGEPNDEFSGYEHLLDKITVGSGGPEENCESDGSTDAEDPDDPQFVDDDSKDDDSKDDDSKDDDSKDDDSKDNDSKDDDDEYDSDYDKPVRRKKKVDNSKFVCFYCEFTCKLKGEFSAHLKTHKGENVVMKCNVCNDVFTKVKALEIHRLTKHPSVFKDKSRKHVCKYCKCGYVSELKLKDHIRAVHTGETPYKCKHCSKKFARKGGLTQHMQFHEGLRPFKCKVCHAKFRSKANKDLHMKAHFGIKEYKCDECGKEFLRKDQLKKHLISVHENRFTYNCSICKKSFKGHVLSHLRIHMNEKLHKCKECGRSFVQSSQLTVHMRTHTGDKPFQCEVCNMSFAHAISLKTHMYKHTGEKPVKCQLCPAAFTQVPHLKKHMRTIHKSDKPYVCVPCHEFFHIKAELVKHLSANKCKAGLSSAKPKN